LLIQEQSEKAGITQMRLNPPKLVPDKISVAIFPKKIGAPHRSVFHLPPPEAAATRESMSTATSISDPKILFDRWFEQPISQLQKLDNEDGGTAGMMVVLPLFERYITILKMNDTSGRAWYQIMADELKLTDAYEAEKFWTTFRHGFCHTAMPLKRGRTIKDLPKVRLAAEYSHRPQFSTLPSGEELLLLAPWKFIHYVMAIYRHDLSLLTRNPDAPLMGIHLFKI
jgi:hypothetical protein